MPHCYCSVCTSVRYGREPSCTDCGAPRPDQGWERLDGTDEPLLGRTIDRRFFITRRIARLDAAALYRASCLTIPHSFALWVCPFDAFDCPREVLYERMEREVRLLRTLEQPAIVAIHEFLELPGGCAAVVIDNIDGPSLETLLPDAAGMDVGRACALTAQLARALHEAHGAQLIHRQLEPGNIVVEQLNDGIEQLRLLNFGLSRLAPAAEDNPTRYFLSPEQRRGDVPDVRSNVYSVGALLFYLLTGRAPSHEWNSAGTWGVRRDRVPRVSKVREPDDVPATLENLVFNLLSPKRPERPGSLGNVVPLIEMFADEASLNFSGSKPAGETAGGGTSDVADALLNTGNYFSLSEQTSVVSAEDLARPSTNSAIEISLSKSLETRLPHESLPDDLDPTSSVSFWPEADNRTGEFGWVNQATTGVRERRPNISNVVCASAYGHGATVVADEDHRIWLARTPSLRDFEQAYELDGPVLSVALGGKRVFAGQPDGTLVSLGADEADADILLETVDRSAISAVAVCSKGISVVAAAETGRVYVGSINGEMDDQDWRRVRSSDPVADVALAAKACTFAVLRSSGLVELRHLDPPNTLMGKFSVDKSARSIALSADGQLVAIVCDDAVYLLHGYSGQRVARFGSLNHVPVSVYFGQENNLFGVCCGDDQVLLCNLATNEPIASTARSFRRSKS